MNPIKARTPIYRYVLPGAIACFGFALSFFLFFASYNKESQKIRAEFNRASLDRINSIKKEIDVNFEILKATHSLYLSSEFVTREEFKRFVTSALHRHSDIKAFEWIPKVPHDQRSNYENTALADGYPDFQITELNRNGETVEAKKRKEYFPVYYLEPYNGNEAMLGLDLAASAIGLEALEKARDTGRIVATGRTKIEHNPGEKFGFLVFMPLYHANAVLDTVESRRNNLKGFVAAIFLFEELFEEGLGLLGKEWIDISLVDNSAYPEESLLYACCSRFSTEDGRFSQKKLDKNILHFSHMLHVADRTWTARCTSRPEFIADRMTWQSWSLLSVGLLFTFLISGYLITTLRRTVQVEQILEKLSLEANERKRIEKKQEELIAELEDKNAELERFSYTVSHDLKSPLITIKGFLGMLRRDVAEGNAHSVKTYMDRISNAADKMQQLLDELLELSRVGRLGTVREDVSLKDLAYEVMELLSGKISQKRITVNISQDMPVVHGERSNLHVLLQNLIDNAINHIGDQPEPRIEVGVRQQGEETVCYVMDNGAGIAPRYHEKIFGLFDKLDQKSNGTGMGLTLAKRIVDVHGGRIWVESKGTGDGCTFCFTIPLKKEIKAYGKS